MSDKRENPDPARAKRQSDEELAEEYARSEIKLCDDTDFSEAEMLGFAKKDFLAGLRKGRELEREACAKIADANDVSGYLHGCNCARNIRAREREEG